MVTQPDQETMEVLVVVAMPPVETRASERAWERSILNAVSAAVYSNKTLNTIAVKPLEYQDCEWIFEIGLPLPKYNVTVFEDGSWHSGVTPFPKEPDAKGDDLQSLLEYLVGKGLVKSLHSRASSDPSQEENSFGE